MKHFILASLFASASILASNALACHEQAPISGEATVTTPPTFDPNTHLDEQAGKQAIDEMQHQKLITQVEWLATAAPVENCWAYEACLEKSDENEAGFDSYAFN